MNPVYLLPHLVCHIRYLNARIRVSELQGKAESALMPKIDYL